METIINDSRVQTLIEAAKICAEAHNVEFKPFFDEYQFALGSESVPVLADMRMICDAVYGHHDMIDTEAGFTTVYLDECKPMESIDFELLSMALPEGSVDRLMSSGDGVTVDGEEVQDIDRFLNRESVLYSLPFDRARQYLSDVSRKMDQAVGWKHPSVPFDYDGFSGYCLDVQNDIVNVLHGADGVVASFYPKEDGSLGFVPYGTEFAGYGEDVNPWFPLADIMNGALCLTDENIQQARKEFHNGNMLVFGVRYGEAAAFACGADDGILRSLLSDKEINIRFVGAEDLATACERWIESNAKAGFVKGPLPEMLVYLYDGQNLRSERDISIVANREMREGWENDWKQIDALREGGEKIRCELERAAGVPEGSHFRFGEAVVPSTLMRNDVLFLSGKYGMPGEAFLTVVNGSVGFYRGYDPAGRYSELKVSYGSVDEALNATRRVCLKEENVNLARKEYQAFTESLVENNGPKIK